MEELSFKLEDFEGPLDLLLALIAKNKMDLHDIPIFALIEQYTKTLEQFNEQRLDIASSFIEMAARLVQMKSYLLLPRSDEGERMREELTGQLIEYELCKTMANKLKAMGENTYIAVRKPMEVEFETEYQLHHDVSLLVEAWQALCGRKRQYRAPKAEKFDALVTAEYVSVTSRVVFVLRNLMAGRVNLLRALFLQSDNKSTTVATFLAVLDLVRHGRIRVEDNEKITLSRHKNKQAERQGSDWT